MADSGRLPFLLFVFPHLHSHRSPIDGATFSSSSFPPKRAPHQHCCCRCCCCCYHTIRIGGDVDSATRCFPAVGAILALTWPVARQAFRRACQQEVHAISGSHWWWGVFSFFHRWWGGSASSHWWWGGVACSHSLPALCVGCPAVRRRLLCGRRATQSLPLLIVDSPRRRTPPPYLDWRWELFAFVVAVGLFCETNGNPFFALFLFFFIQSI